MRRKAHPARLESDGADYSKTSATAEEVLPEGADGRRHDAGRSAGDGCAVHAAAAAADDRALPAHEEGSVYAAGDAAPAAGGGRPVSVSGRGAGGGEAWPVRGRPTGQRAARGSVRLWGGVSVSGRASERAGAFFRVQQFQFVELFVVKFFVIEFFIVERRAGGQLNR